MTIAEKLVQIAENEQRVYEAGKRAGGGNTTYDEFWEVYQDGGNRKDYLCAFAGSGWTKETFKPKYPMNVTNAFEMFRGCGDVDILANGIEMDFSNNTSLTNFAHSSGLVSIGVFNVVRVKTLSYTFFQCRNLVTIEKLIVNASNTYQKTFEDCRNLETLIVEGTIGQNGLDLQWSTKLSRASIDSILYALDVNATGLSITLSKAAVDKAYETTEGANDGANSDYWIGYTTDSVKKNWTFALV